MNYYSSPISICSSSITKEKKREHAFIFKLQYVDCVLSL